MGVQDRDWYWEHHEKQQRAKPRPQPAKPRPVNHRKAYIQFPPSVTGRQEQPRSWTPFWAGAAVVGVLLIVVAAGAKWLISQ